MFATDLIFSLCFLTFLQNCLGNPPSYLITSPDVLRVGTEETALVNVFNTAEDTVSVQIYIENYPNRENRFSEVTVDVTADSPKIVKLRINPDDIVPTNSELKFVYLVAKSQSPALTFVKEKRVLITYRQGYVFIQTDKPLYTPEQQVMIRIIPLDMQMLPSTDKFRLEIINGNGNIVEKLDDLQTEQTGSGFYSYPYQFPKFPVFGNWTVKVSYGYLYKLESTVKFEVKEYVLPTFTVKFKVKPAYVLPSTTRFLIEMEAKYIYGEAVQGIYNLNVGYIDANGETVVMRKFSGDVGLHGKDSFSQSVSLAEIIGNEFRELDGKKLYLEAIVKSSDGKVEKCIDTSAPFTFIAYKLQTMNMLKYFKPGLPYSGKVKLLQANNKPAVQTPAVVSVTLDGEPFMFSPGDDELEISSNEFGDISMRIDIPKNTKSVTITITPKGEMVESENGEFEVTLTEHVTSSGDAMLVRATTDVVPGNIIGFEVVLTADTVVDRIYFMVVSKGKILEQGSTNVGGVVITLNIPITFEMTPSARIITYFVDKNNKIVADSLYLDINEECENQVTLRTENDKYEPSDPVNLLMYAKPNTYIGLVAVDKAVLQLRDTSRLTLKKMFETMETFDLGCGPGGGINAQSVFEDSGLSTVSDVIDTDLKIGFGCQNSQRRRRALPYTYQDESDPELVEICEQGFQIIKGMTCEQRTERIAKRKDLPVDNPLVQRYYNCCRLMVDGMSRGRIGGGNPDSEFIDDIFVPERSDFRESFLFEDVLIPEEGEIGHEFTLPDSITKWLIQGVALSRDLGMCVANPVTLTAFKKIFIQLDVPYSVVRGEQVEIKATLFNYDERKRSIKVAMYLIGTEGICSEAHAGQRSSKKDFEVNPDDSYSVTYPMIPLKVGEFEIRVVAYTSVLNDAVTKTLRVIPEGVTRYFTLSQILDPSGKLNGQPEVNELQESSAIQADQLRNREKRSQTDIVDLRLPPDAIEGTAHCKVKFTGKIKITNNYSWSIVKGGVQGDVSFTAYVLITLLECSCAEHANQVSSAVEKAVTFIETEFEKGVITRPFAVAIATFALTLADSPVKDRMNLKLREIATYSAGSSKSIGGTFQSAVPTRHWGANDSSFAGSKKPFWYVRRPSAIAVETTSYALRTQVLNNDIEYCNPIVNWLTEQRNYDGGFVSTQDTIIALQALEEYTKITESDQLNLQCRLVKDQYERHVSINENNALHHQEETPPVNGNLIIETTGTGIGQAQVEVRYNSDAKTPREHCAFDVEAIATKWDSTGWKPVNGLIAVPTDAPEKVGVDADCNRDRVDGRCEDEASADIDTDNSRSRIGRSSTKSSYILDIRACTRYHGHEKTGMSIIEVGIYSGFKAKKEDLELVKQEVDLVKRYEEHDRAVVFYLDSIPRDEQVCLNFRASREKVVSAIQPVAVNVYDYYEPEEKCSDFYHPVEGSDLLNLLCSDAEMCICATGNCALCNSKKTKSQLKTDACSQNIDYAFEVSVISASDTNAFNVYNCSVEVIKPGIDDIQGNIDIKGIAYRTFWKSKKCRCPEIQAGKKYLIMGVDGLKTTDKDGFTVYKYIIDEQAYVEYWPGVGRVGRQAKKRLKKLNGLKSDLKTNGCAA
ncbi:complement C3-like [Anneissia japonica]|uniref:complement C3-like n=1 Tax=Anneissia japonica TaxID=1529436 RepID=UPI00142555F8|nr:complement C3-like [Anneissia japonica]